MPILPSSSTQTLLSKKKGWSRAALLGAGLALIALAVYSVCSGSASISLGELFRVLTGEDTHSKAARILWLVRFPRTLAAVLAGSALAVSGAILQAVLDNPLASPNTIGVNAGAGVFTIALAAFFPQWVGYTPLASFAGALFAVLAVYEIARRTGASRMTIVLSGVAVTSFLGAITDSILTIAPTTQMSRVEFLIGSFSGVSSNSIGLAGVIILLGLGLSLVLSFDLNVLGLGEETAASLGLPVSAYRMAFLVIAALLAGSAVSFSGLIGFVGLIVPHLARMLVGGDNRTLLPLCVLMGGAFTLGCDILARTLFSPFEIPVGVVMSFLGGPFFIYLLLSKKGVRMG